MSRAYASKDLTQKLPSLTLALDIFLRHYSYLPQKTFFGHFSFEYENVLGVIMALFYFILQVLTVFLSMIYP